MNAHAVFLLAWCTGMLTAVALAYNGNVLLAFLVILVCAGLSSSKA